MDDKVLSILDCVDGEKSAEKYVWEINTRSDRIFGVLIGQRILSDGSIQTLIFDRGGSQTPCHTEVPWSAIETIRHAKELSSWLTNKKPS